MLKFLSSKVSVDSDISYLSAVKFFACLDVERKFEFFKVPFSNHFLLQAHFSINYPGMPMCRSCGGVISFLIMFFVYQLADCFCAAKAMRNWFVPRGLAAGLAPNHRIFGHHHLGISQRWSRQDGRLGLYHADVAAHSCLAFLG